MKRKKFNTDYVSGDYEYSMSLSNTRIGYKNTFKSFNEVTLKLKIKRRH